MDDKSTLLNFLGTFYGQAAKLDQDTVQKSATASPVSVEYKRLFEQVAKSPQPQINPQPVQPVAAFDTGTAMAPYQPPDEQIIQQLVPATANGVYAAEPIVPEDTLPAIVNVQASTEAVTELSSNQVIVELSKIYDILINIEKLLTSKVQIKPNVRTRKTKDTKQA